MRAVPCVRGALTSGSLDNAPPPYMPDICMLEPQGSRGYQHRTHGVMQAPLEAAFEAKPTVSGRQASGSAASTGRVRRQRRTSRRFWLFAGASLLCAAGLTVGTALLPRVPENEGLGEIVWEEQQCTVRPTCNYGSSLDDASGPEPAAAAHLCAGSLLSCSARVAHPLCYTRVQAAM